MKLSALIALLFAAILLIVASIPKVPRFESIKAFIDAAPKATNETDLSYKVKIPEKERREAIKRCRELLAADDKNKAATILLFNLTAGEGNFESVAFCSTKTETTLNKIVAALDANLISTGGVPAHASIADVSVWASQAARARRVIAQTIITEHLEEIALIKIDGSHVTHLSPESLLEK